MVSANENDPPAVGPMAILRAAAAAYRAGAAEPDADIDRLKIDLAICALRTQSERLAKTAEILQVVARLLDR